MTEITASSSNPAPDRSRRGVALVTGASQGIGEGIALRLSAEGYYLVINHFNRAEDASRVVDKIKSAGGDAMAISADVGSSASVAAMFSQVSALPLPLKLLVNNAGVQTFAPLIDLKEEDFDRTLRTNLKGTFLCMQQAARLMKETGGDMINIGSGANRIPFRTWEITAPARRHRHADESRGCRVRSLRNSSELHRSRSDRKRADQIGRSDLRQDLGGHHSTTSRRNNRRRRRDRSYAAHTEANFINGQTIFVDGGLWIRGQWPYAF
ncbi:MAG: SDR family NAD(P)-dependent oxidoreductase [Pirellulales bacterium]